MHTAGKKTESEISEELVPRLSPVPVPDESVPRIDLFMTQAHLGTRLSEKMIRLI
jgi:hypothetical protein